MKSNVLAIKTVAEGLCILIDIYLIKLKQREQRKST